MPTKLGKQNRRNPRPVWPELRRFASVDAYRAAVTSDLRALSVCLAASWAASLIVVGILLLIVLILALVGARSLKSAQAHRPDPAASVAATKEAIEKGLGK